MLSALQHVGLGVSDAASSYAFYRKLIGFNIKMADHQDYSQQMEPIIGDLVKMRIIMAAPSQGSGLIELVQHISTSPRPQDLRWGDIGFLTSGYRAQNLPALVNRFEQMGARFEVRSYPIELASGQRWESAFLLDPDGNLIELIDKSPGQSENPIVGGLIHVTIGVRDIDRSLPFYRDIVGYDKVLLDTTGREPSLDRLFGDELTQRQVLLARNQRLESPLAMPDGGTIRLVQVHDYEGKELFAERRWGDIGQMEACFEVKDIQKAVAELKSMNVEIFHPPTYMDLGTGSSGSFAYIKDPDGILIEFVEINRVLWMSPRVFSLVFRALSPFLAKLPH